MRKIAEEVSLSILHTHDFKKILQGLSVAMRTRDDSAAIAAPQIDVSMRIFAISRNIRKFIQQYHPELVFCKKGDMYFINPQILWISKEKTFATEACLSVDNVQGEVGRATFVKIEAHDQLGRKMILKTHGMLARIFQHEIDHLDGILFVDKASNIRPIQ